MNNDVVVILETASNNRTRGVLLPPGEGSVVVGIRLNWMMGIGEPPPSLLSHMLYYTSLYLVVWLHQPSVKQYAAASFPRSISQAVGYLLASLFVPFVGGVTATEGSWLVVGDPRLANHWE